MPKQTPPPEQDAILIVEDDDIVLEILTDGLIQAGMRAIGVHSAEEALEHLSHDAGVRLAILDITLPGMSGLDLARLLRERDAISFIMLSAHDDDDLVERAVADGALCYLVKPVDLRKLVPVVRAALARDRDLRQLQESGRKLEDALHADRAVSVAIGMLMARERIDERTAFNMLRADARSRRVKLAEHARRVIGILSALN